MHHNNPGIVEKIQCAKAAYDAVSAASVRNMFEHCGLIGNEPPASVVQRLVHEGIRPGRRDFQWHSELVDDLFAWAGQQTGKMDIAREKMDSWGDLLASFVKQ